MKTVESHAAGGNRVDVRRAYGWVAVAAKMVRAVLIRDDEQEIRLLYERGSVVV